VGDSFAGFELVEQLGCGAFGVVFRAKQADLAARDVVLKITAPRSIEPQRLAKLQHTNIVPLYSIHEDGGLLAICMPYFGHRTMTDFIRRDNAIGSPSDSTIINKQADTTRFGQPGLVELATPGPEKIGMSPPAIPTDVDSIVEMISQLAEGLAHAHERGIVHSDLKPANVLITDDAVPMLLDFNLSSDAASYQKATLFVGGTLPYMAPEHLLATLNGGPVGAASDVYSLGVMAFELLTGKRPFRDHSGDFEQTVDALLAERQRQVPSVRSLNPQVSEGLSAIVSRCLNADLESRYATSAQLAEDLRRYQQDLPLRHASDRSIRERAAKWLRRNARAVRWTAAASLVVLLVSISAMYMERHHRLADFEAAKTFSDFENDVQTALANLHTPGAEPELRTLGLAAAKRAIERFGLIESGIGNFADFSRLTPAQQSDVRRQGIELLYTLAALRPYSAHTGRPNADQQDLQDAIQYNSAALTLLPPSSSSKSLLEQRVKLLKAAGDERSASTIADQARQASPDEQDACLAAVALLKKGDLSEAIVAWQQLCAQNRRDPLRWLLLAYAYVGAGQLAHAEACYTAFIALQPDSMTGYLYRGLCRADQSMYAAAENDFSEALRLNPSVAVAHINRALAYYAMQDFKAAEADCSAAIEAGLADPRAYFVRALVRDAMGQRGEAKADRERGLSLPPVDDKGWVARGMSLLRDNPQRAAREFEQGHQKFPTSTPLLQNLIHVYGDRLNRSELALDYANKLVELKPNDASARASRAVLEARNGDATAALHDAERAAASHPSALTSLQIACVYALVARTQPAEATRGIRHFQHALARDPKLAQRAASDPDLSALQNNPEFKEIQAAAAKLTEPTSSLLPQSANSNANGAEHHKQDDEAQHKS
jgi:serine/threonine protein kinase/Flp pilus assembly protein TadD